MSLNLTMYDGTTEKESEIRFVEYVMEVFGYRQILAPGNAAK
jgi:hypothetical protein